MKSSDTVGQKVACQLLDVTAATLSKYVKNGQLSCTRDEQNRRRFVVRDINQLNRQRAASPKAAARMLSKR